MSIPYNLPYGTIIRGSRGDLHMVVNSRPTVGRGVTNTWVEAVTVLADDESFNGFAVVSLWPVDGNIHRLHCNWDLEVVE